MLENGWEADGPLPGAKWCKRTFGSVNAGVCLRQLSVFNPPVAAESAAFSLAHTGNGRADADRTCMLGGVAQTLAKTIGLPAAGISCIPVGHLADRRTERRSTLAPASIETEAHFVFRQSGSPVQIATGQRYKTTDGNESETGGVVHFLSMGGKLNVRNQDRAKRVGTPTFGALADQRPNGE